MTTDSELEHLFIEHDVPRRHLYPLFYRLNHKVGIRHKPPVMLNLAEFYLYTAPGMIFVVATGTLIHYWLTSRFFLNAMPLLTVFILAPLIGWLRYWFIRRRIGLAGGTGADH